MTRALALIVVIGIMSLTEMGCQQSKKTDVAEGATDVTAPTQSYAAASPAQPAYAPAPQPVVYDTTTTTPQASATSGSGAYTVKRGDTLYSIARTRYGDGKQWQKIASANPGLRPETLKVGQTITIP